MIQRKRPSEDVEYGDFFDRFFMGDSTDKMVEFEEK